MPDLLLELRSEEIPARMQRKAAGDLRKLVTDALVDAGLTYEGAREYWTPRRLTLDIRGLTARSKDVSEEIKGPSTKAPEQAVQGFLRKAGLADLSEAHVHTDPKKGDFYVARIVKPGRAAEEIIAEIMPGIIRGFPWPKSMRWGKASALPGALRWVRPLQSILCTFGPETEEPVVIAFEVDGVTAGNVTYGHRFHAPEAITIRRFADYADKLLEAKVVLDAERRKEIIAADARNLAFAAGLELVEDPGLLEEVSGLVEWPVVLMGEFEPEYLEIPGEVIRLTIKTNQKCFVLRSANGGIANRFVLVSNIEARDGGREIAHGNAKVVRARLSDALYFWKTDQADLPDLAALETSAEKFGLDLSKPLDQRMAKLDHLNVTFHAKLGTQGERVERIARLAEELAPLVGADPALARRAALLAKADLTTEVVGEFPELQGAIGRKYAELQGEHPSVAAAIEEHYKPQGPSDAVPADPVSIAVALADKLDTLVGFWAIDEKPTGSKDPFALRRAALGVIRILVENDLPVHLVEKIDSTLQLIVGGWCEAKWLTDSQGIERYSFDEYMSDEQRGRKFDFTRDHHFAAHAAGGLGSPGGIWLPSGQSVRSWLLSFFHDRLKVYLKDQGARHDLIDAVLGAGHRPISPLVGEMPDRAEGGKSPRAGMPDISENAATPPSVASVSGNEPRVSSRPSDPATRGESSAPKSAATANDDLLSVVRRVEALGVFLATENGSNLLAGAKRAANILAAEEKKGTEIAATVDPALFVQDEEKNLFNAVNQITQETAQAVEDEDYSAAMAALANLREPVDSFFEAVLVNAEDVVVRANRLALVGMIREATSSVADFSRIAG